MNKILPFFFLLSVTVFATNWEDLDNILTQAIRNKAFPGAVAIVGGPDGILYSKAFGSYVYPGETAPVTGTNPQMTLNTLFDCASLTKVLATTTATARLYEAGYLSLSDLVTKHLGPTYASFPGKEKITIMNLMAHTAGYRDDPVPGYPSKAFGCPSTSISPPPLVFSCQDRILQAIYDEPLIYAPGTQYIYSDTSMMTLMFIIGRLARIHSLVAPRDLRPDCVAHTGLAGAHLGDLALPVDQCYFEAYIRKQVTEPLGLKNMMYLPPTAIYGSIAPTENDTNYRRAVVQGVVHDENAYASGGVQGHAALFSTVPDAAVLVRRLLFAHERYRPVPVNFVNATTVGLFTAVCNVSFSSRAVGWDTNQDQIQCGTLAKSTFRHTGFTGTQICADPERMVYTLLFTNRVYPTRANTQIQKVRTAFNTAVQQIFDKKYPL